VIRPHPDSEDQTTRRLLTLNRFDLDAELGSTDSD
jgi:hypothetical protein